MASPREVAIANLAKSNRNRKHDTERYLSLNPEGWPEDARAMFEERFAQLVALPHIDLETDQGAVALACRLEVLLAKAYEWLSKRGFNVEEPLMRTLAAFENSLGRAYERLGLSPEARKRLGIGVQRRDLATVLSADDEVVDVGSDEEQAARGSDENAEGDSKPQNGH